ncbi:TetR/AcrR family transcriptional regulator [Streptomyces sp. SID12501]|uniref:Helix-turn-helix transcriptional regulator n=1 Tax=Streptomyces sp. SID12501 TaxID=2706042 RepID=A0A6B3BYA9_9ACTN|nr:helix-turn-helix domain-containing protein [Streptomyces sp. SID12501]NEC89302.1 helix-turn-helix transcriptional regulator [Streptomyces sp. SID12501]
MAGRARQDERSVATQQSLLIAAERLFAERGVHAVANRQISEAAGQGNNAAVSYHFGTKTDVVRAIVRKHTEHMERLREGMMADLDESAGLRDWVGCMVRPVTDHLEALGSPTWYARFTAQVMADPALHAIMIEESLAVSPSVRRLLEGLNQCTPGLPVGVHFERAVMARHLIVQMCVERERALADHSRTYRPTWHDTATGLIDAIVGLWQAPFTHGA